MAGHSFRPRSRFFSYVLAIAGGAVERRLARGMLLLPKITALGPGLEKLGEHEIRRQSLSLRYRAKSGEPLVQLLPEAFALVREAGRRKLGMSHFDTQLLGGIAMQQRAITEMETGEGKTLTATLPLYLHALAGRGAMLATVNDYLARRDADWMRPIYELLGLTVGVIESKMPPNQRRQSYAADITYGTSKEFGFDFLRDQLLLRTIRHGQSDLIGKMLGQAGGSRNEQPLQRAPYFILVDEADSILIDEARTPLIISALPDEQKQKLAACYRWAAENVRHFKDPQHYAYDHLKQTAELTVAGRQQARVLPKPGAMDTLDLFEIYRFVERAIRADRSFRINEHFVVRDDEVVIVDEFTGRLGEGRKWRDGLHQAIEAKAGVTVTVDSGQAARVTVQDFFSRFECLAGMTGTCVSSARELRKIYNVQVVPVPTNRRVLRRRLPTRIYGTSQAKWQAVIEEIRAVHAQQRPVLIGTRSIDKSEHLSRLLVAEGIEHQVLNARLLKEEAEIVAQAGQRGKVTVSTNMAGRGTDIKLGEGIAELGGLHVICTEMNESARIDRQLFGRCGRQGDPGTYRVFLALDDELLLIAFGPKPAARYKRRGLAKSGSWDGYFGLFRKAQRKVERRHFHDRKALLYFERERQKMQRQMGQDPHLDSPS